MITTTPMPLAATAPSDSDLVQRCLTDGAAAFSEIVARYQTLICSLAYNATGNLSRSEDLAQEVFVTAWKELRHLREPAKLRPWLCGIARRLTANSRRRDDREPVCAAEELEDQHHESAPAPDKQAISREEEAILWRSLEKIPEAYREPLILFYREDQSVANVAAALDLTEDAAKQRLSRGRKLLQEQVALFIEGALRMSTPGRAFTLGVVAALPLMKTSATAATLGTAAAKTGAAATGVSWLAVLSALIGPLVGCLGGWLGVKVSLESAESERERVLIRKQTRGIMALVVVFLVAMGFAMPFAARIWSHQPGVAVAVTTALPFLYVIALVLYIVRFRRQHARVIAEEAARRNTPEATARRAEVWKTFEYISPWRFLGLPLIHIRTGRPSGSKLRPAVGWIAIGDLAIGVLFSMGGLAIGGISMGGLSLGLFAAGGAALGAVSWAGLAIGLYAATGGLAVGYLAHGAIALGWHAAGGGMAVARDFALGQSASAAHINDAAARQAIDSLGFFRLADALMHNPLFFIIVWCPFVLIIWQAQRARQALKRQADLK
jgi:RNA polymerase sigma factor (sigma-70 family)